MGHVEGTVSETRASRSTRLATSRSPRASAVQPEQTDGGVKVLYGLLGLIVIGYAVSLVLRANGASTTWLDGWGVAAYELVCGVLVLVRAAVSPKDRDFCLALGTAMCLWALGDFAETYAGLHNPSPPPRFWPTTCGPASSRWRTSA